MVRVVEEVRPNPVRPPGGSKNGTKHAVELVDAVIENLLFRSNNNNSEMSDPGGGSSSSPTNTPNQSSVSSINFNPDDQLLNKLEKIKTLEDQLEDDIGYEFNPLPIFVMAGIIVCGIIVLTVYCTVRWKLLRICCKSGKTDEPVNNQPTEQQPNTSDTSCSEGEQTPGKPGARPKALQKASIDNPYPVLNAKLGIKTQQRSQTIITGSQGMNALRWMKFTLKLKTT